MNGDAITRHTQIIRRSIYGIEEAVRLEAPSVIYGSLDAIQKAVNDIHAMLLTRGDDEVVQGGPESR